MVNADFSKQVSKMKIIFCLILVPTVLSLQCYNSYTANPPLEDQDELSKSISGIPDFNDLKSITCQSCLSIKLKNFKFIDDTPRSVSVQSCLPINTCSVSLCDIYKRRNVDCEMSCCTKDFCNSSVSLKGFHFWKWLLLILFVFSFLQ
ncbi:uncharacterized protein LOC124816651 [Hydra vulgaris]|uniref:uncharacterized protein LOC124816651 n=1 Tax=Hydra vulgaris TaxID=6087 RepID=UPI001F5F23E5|nr:uncharacterized protein LOC124816651 [Hydra vulgaris]